MKWRHSVCLQSVVFKRSSRGLARSMWLKNVKITVITVVAILVSALGIILMATVFFASVYITAFIKYFCSITSVILIHDHEIYIICNGILKSSLGYVRTISNIFLVHFLLDLYVITARSKKLPPSSSVHFAQFLLLSMGVNMIPPYISKECHPYIVFCALAYCNLHCNSSLSWIFPFVFGYAYNNLWFKFGNIPSN